MKRLKTLALIFGGLAIIYFGASVLRNISVIEQITELQTDHFVITYQGIYTEEAQETAKSLEENYSRIRVDLKDPDHETIRVYIHPTQTDFNKATGLPNSTAKGTSRGPNEFHLIWTNWFSSVFPADPVKTAVHEFTHCVQLNILIKEAQREWGDVDDGEFDKMFEKKFINEYPQWFWEALCDYEADVVNRISVKYGMDKTLSLKELNNSNQIYNVGFTIVDYIVETWGRDKLPMLITSYVDIEGVLGVSESDFEKGWVDFVANKY